MGQKPISMQKKSDMILLSHISVNIVHKRHKTTKMALAATRNVIETRGKDLRVCLTKTNM